MSDLFFEQLRGALALLDRDGLHLGNRAAVSRGEIFGDIAPPDIRALFGERTFDGIPTMVAPRELRLMHNFLSVTPLAGDVLEIGPYLGGSTSAIGRGLVAAGHNHRLFALDAFAWNDPPFIDHLSRDIFALAKTRTLRPTCLSAARRGEWYDAFVDAHQTAPYAAMLQPIRFRLPSATYAPKDSLAGVLPTDHLAGVFIDGFKSWQATYHAMDQLKALLQPGAIIAFQDFSWHDCYWLPVLRSRLKLSLVAKCTNTAIFRLDAAITPEALVQFGENADPTKFDRYYLDIENHARAMLHSGDDTGYIGHLAQMLVLARVMERHSVADTMLRRIDEMKIDWLSKALRKRDFTIKAG